MDISPGFGAWQHSKYLRRSHASVLIGVHLIHSPASNVALAVACAHQRVYAGDPSRACSGRAARRASMRCARSDAARRTTTWCATAWTQAHSMTNIGMEHACWARARLCDDREELPEWPDP
eukprot:6198979-Pleurochrysis_carterae.AAC.1